MDIQKEMIDLITKSLPEANAVALREYLNKAAQFEKERDEWRKSCNQNADSLIKSKSENCELHVKMTTLINENTKLKQDNKQLIELNEHRKTKEAELQAFHLQETNKQVFNLVETVFRNPKFVTQTTIDKSIPVVVPGSSNCNGYVTNYNENHKVTKTETQE